MFCSQNCVTHVLGRRSGPALPRAFRFSFELGVLVPYAMAEPVGVLWYVWRSPSSSADLLNASWVGGGGGEGEDTSSPAHSKLCDSAARWALGSCWGAASQEF